MDGIHTQLSEDQAMPLADWREAEEAGVLFGFPPDVIGPAHIDRAILGVVLRINESGWVWTRWSCQGHYTGGEELVEPPLRVPYLSLCCRGSGLQRLLGIILDATTGSEGSPSVETVVEIDHFPNDWIAASIHVEGTLPQLPQGQHLERVWAFFDGLADGIEAAGHQASKDAEVTSDSGPCGTSAGPPPPRTR